MRQLFLTFFAEDANKFKNHWHLQYTDSTDLIFKAFNQIIHLVTLSLSDGKWEREGQGIPPWDGGGWGEGTVPC
jgi:hypothetical protein